MKNACMILMLLAFAGCRHVDPHPWTREQPNWMWADHLGDVTYVGTNRLSRVNPEHFTNAVARLAETAVVELDPDTFREMAADPVPGNPGERPFLLRGVTWSYPPLYTIVYWRADGTTLCVEQYTYNLEIYFPGRYASGANPLIAYLEKAPLDVVPRAIFGGDHVIGGMRQPYAWME